MRRSRRARRRSPRGSGRRRGTGRTRAPRSRRAPAIGLDDLGLEVGVGDLAELPAMSVPFGGLAARLCTQYSERRSERELERDAPAKATKPDEQAGTVRAQWRRARGSGGHTNVPRRAAARSSRRRGGRPRGAASDERRRARARARTSPLSPAGRNAVAASSPARGRARGEREDVECPTVLVRRPWARAQQDDLAVAERRAVRAPDAAPASSGAGDREAGVDGERAEAALQRSSRRLVASQLARKSAISGRAGAGVRAASRSGCMLQIER